MSDHPNASTECRALRVELHEAEVALRDQRERVAELRRKNVLIVPTVFCADADYMRSLRQRIQEDLDDMTVAFLPGIGGRLHLAPVSPGE